jgi:hypothetical protein
MNNIVPDSVNDRINSLFKQVNTVNKTITNLTSNYISDSSDNSLVVNSNTFTINTDNSGILLGDKTNPDSMILYGTSDPTTIVATDVPNGSIYLTSDASGKAYLKVNDLWTTITTDLGGSGSTITNLNVSGEATIGNNMFVQNNVNISGTMTVDGNILIDGILDVNPSIYTNEVNVGQGGTIITNNITTDYINCLTVSTSNNINCSGNIINYGNITSYGNISGNSLNINSKFNIDSSGNLDSSGSMNVSGNINVSGTINDLTLTSQSEGFSISGGLTSKTLTVNRTLNFSGTDNTTMTFPSTSQTLIGTDDVQNLTNKTINLTAGTVSQAPLQFTSGTNLTTALSGAIEYDGNNYYATSIDCNATPIRKILPNMNYYRIDSDRATINTSDLIYTYDVFPSGTFTMDADAYYIVDWTLNWIINSNSDMRYDIVTSSAPQYIVIGGLNIATPNSGVSMNYGTTTTTSFSNMQLQGIGANTGTYVHTLRAYILNGSTNGTTIKLQIYTTNANITLKRGSRIFITKMPNANFGNFS